MTRKSSRVRLGVGLLCLLTIGWVLTGRAAKLGQQGIPTDWTHRHVIFSQPATAMQAGFLANEPRFWQQEMRRLLPKVVSDPGVAGVAMPDLRFGKLTAFAKRGDWSQNLGSSPTVGAGNFPAKFSFRATSANCGNATTPDFVVFGTGLLSASGQASIVAYDNLYAGCTGTVPSTYWAYNTSGRVTTSPVLSADGSQIAFVEDNGFQVATLVLLKWKASTTESVTSPGTPTLVSTLSNYPTCTAPCMAQIPLIDNGFVSGDTASSVFYDYSLDAAWVGDSMGYLHQFHPVFGGTPAEITTSPWPVQVNPSNANVLSSPVHDLVSNNVYVGDMGGFLYRVSASTGAVTTSARIDSGVGVAGPVVDSTAQKVYAFASNDGSTSCAGSPCSAFYVFSTTFASGNAGTKATAGTSSATPSPLYVGGFDSTYLASSNATGDVFVCGNTGGAPTLYRIAINAGVPGATGTVGPALASATTACSPVTDISNPNAIAGGTEWIFASVQNNGSGNSCASGGCLMNFRNQPWKPNTAYVVGQQVLDTHFQIQTVRVAGTSRATTPGWSTVIGGSTADNTVRWRNQGPQVAAHAAWQPTTAYALPKEILDTNGNIQLAISAGTSKSGTHPIWNTTVDLITTDGSVHWRNVGSLSTVSLAAAGGTSGMIIDNFVGSGTLAGASQVYFSTLSNQACTTGGTGGCAVQASQSALQ